jgi:predicted site-specific integrase-resolvase
MKVAIYARISTDRGEQNIKQQVAYVREFCKRKGYEIYKVYKDEKTHFLSDQALCLYFMKKSARNGRFSVLGNTFQEQKDGFKDFGIP